MSSCFCKELFCPYYTLFAGMLQVKTAILFFSRTFDDEFKAKSFGLSKVRFRDFYCGLVNKSLCVAKASGFQVFHVYSSEQEGDSFGERLANAVKSVKNKGVERVIVIGNDCPELNSNHLKEAAGALKSKPGVILKDKRGGVALLGLDLRAVNFQSLSQISWNSRTVAQELTVLLNAFSFGTELRDVNSYRDIIRLKKESSNWVLRFVLLLSAAFVQTYQTVVQQPIQLLRANTLPFWKGPPLQFC